MKTLKFKGTEVSLSFDSYQNNGSLAVLMNTVPDDELYGVITVNLGSFLQTDRLAFVDENNLPGIGAWLRKNKIASPLGYKERSGDASTSSTPSTITRREALDSIEYLQVSNGLEILVSIGRRLTFNIRSEGAGDGDETIEDIAETRHSSYPESTL